MTARRRLLRIAALVAVTVLAAWYFAGIRLKPGGSSAGDSADRLIAFSLTVAEQQSGAGAAIQPLIANLAGMTRLLGLVYDRSRRDLILVGRAEPSRQPLDLASLVVALRAVLVRHEWPLVSIDPTPESAVTRKQIVRLEGDIAGSQFGQDFFLADVRLKRLGLGLEKSDGLEKLSYFRLRAAAASREERDGGGRSRFWFYAIDPGLEQRDDVFLIRQLRLGVRAQTVSVDPQQARPAQDPAAETFSATLTKSFPELCARFPDLDRLQSLYEMVAVARGMQMIPEAISAYWLKDYVVPVVATPRTFDLVGRQERLDTPNGPRYLEVSGGIQFKALTVRLLDGDVTALKEAVLLSRPASNRLSWVVPIGADFVQGRASAALPRGRDADSDAGSQLTWEIAQKSKEAAQRKLVLEQNIAEVEKYLKQMAPQFLKPLKEETQITGDYHSSDQGITNYRNGSTLEKAAQSQGMYHYDAQDNTFKLNNSPALETSGSSGGGGFLCVTASCVGPKQATSDGLKADPYYRADLNPYSLHRFVDAGYTVSRDGKAIGSGYGDVKLLGDGVYAAKEWNGAGYQIHDASGKSISKTFGAVQAIGSTGYFAVPNEGGLGMTTVYNSQMRSVTVVPSYDLNSYVQGVDFHNRLQKDAASNSGGVEHQASKSPSQSAVSPQPVGGIKADIKITDQDFQQRRLK